jgi:methionyl aminopeptidase
MIHFAAKIERNDPCWCGSGKKYKNCHMRFDEKIRGYQLGGYIVPDRSIIKTPEQIEGMPKRKYLFKLDCEHMDWCDTLLFLFDGRVPDEGACFELGYCYAKGKECIGYKTDARSFIDGYDNVMLHGAPEVVLHNERELRAFFTVD